jgi:hypothetical protein
MHIAGSPARAPKLMNGGGVMHKPDRGRIAIGRDRLCSATAYKMFST